MSSSLLPLYPSTLPLRTHALNVGSGHVVHVEESGRADGIPAVVLHGGPGSGFSPLLRRYFDLARYRVICVDQRGCGRSTPLGAIDQNTTSHLLDDLRTVRQHLGIERWLVVGGSWGATLAVAHAFREPEAVSGLLLRSLFLARPEDVHWFFQGASSLLPQAWARFASAAEAAGAVEGAAGSADNLLPFFADALTRQSAAHCLPLALAWWRWEQALAGRPQASESELNPVAQDALVHRYRVQGHFLRHGCWLSDTPVLSMCTQVPAVPTLLLHGSEDRICLPEAAQAAHQRIQGSRLLSIPEAGHDPTHPAMVHAMVAALDEFASTANFEHPQRRWVP
jgi:proline iminopeptidase